MFRGINAVNIDSKGRLAIPSRYRDCLAHDYEAKLVVTIDTDARCLLLYPLAEWEVIEQKIQALPSFNPHARRIQRLLIGHASEMEIDSNGRILLPGLLREYASLEKRVMLVGQGKKFELWSEQTWMSQRENWLEQEASVGDALPPEMQGLSL